jgi:hypothetical protein
MNRKFAKISAAALAGASCLLSSHAAKGALTIVATKVASSVAFFGGTYDVIVFDLTALTGVDATKGTNSGNSQDAEVVGLNGTFTVTGGTGTTEMAAIGTAGAGQAAAFLAGAAPTYSSGTTVHSSYVAFKSDTGATITEVGTSSGKKGNALTFSDSWYTTPTAGNGNVGGVEPGKDPQKLTVADQSSSNGDVYANNGLLAEILVNPGASVSFAGSYSDYGFTSGNATTFSYTPLVTGSTSSTTGTNKIVSLIATTSGAPVGTAPNGYGTVPLGTLAVTNAGGPGKYFPGYLNIPGGATSGYVAVAGFLPNDYPEVYALKLSVNGVAATTSQIATIISDIQTSIGGQSNASLGIASVTTVAGSPYASLFGGYSIIVTDTSVDPYFAFDFSSSGSDTTDADSALGPVTVTSIAAVPEPATAAGVILGAAGLLLGRRKNRVVAV